LKQSSRSSSVQRAKTTNGPNFASPSRNRFYRQ
jgi:hypothetical protein